VRIVDPDISVLAVQRERHDPVAARRVAAARLAPLDCDALLSYAARNHPSQDSRAPVILATNPRGVAIKIRHFLP